MPHKNFKIILLLLFAVIIGYVYIYPDIKLIHELKDKYRGITMTATNDELKYLGSLNAFYKGDNFTLSGFDNYEHKSQPWTIGFFPEIFLGFIGKSLRISVLELDILMSFLLPALLFILIYILTFKLSRSMNLSLLSSATILLGYHIFTAKVGILKGIFTFNYPEPLWFLRPISPQFNHIMLILSLLLIYEALNSKKTFILWIAAVVIGLQFYTFIYSLTFIYAGLLVLAIVFFIIKKETGYLLRIIFIFLFSLLMSIPYWINLWRLIHLSDYYALEYFNNVVYSHKPILPLFHVVLTAFILLSYTGKKLNFSFWYIFGFLIGGFICLNQHIISGKVLFPGHWLGYSNKTFLIISLFVSLNNFKENYFIKKIINNIFMRRLIISSGLFILLIFAFNQQIFFYNKNKAFYIKKQNLAPVFSWLKQHTKKNDVILTDPFNYLSHNFPEYDDVLVYSHNFSFLPVSACTVLSKEELEDRYIISLTLFVYAQDEAREFFEYKNGIQFVRMQAIKEYGGEGIKPEYIIYLKEKFKLFQNEQVLFSKLKNYRLDYIIVDSDEKIKRILQRFKNVLCVYSDTNFVILKFIR